MTALADGTATVPATADQLVPRNARTSPVGDAAALLTHEYKRADDLPPYTPHSWDDVVRASDVYRLITAQQADELRALVEIPAARTD